MVYDSLNQLKTVKSGEKQFEFIYDPMGRRLIKVISTKDEYGWEESTLEYYLYDEKEEIGSFNSPNMIDFSDHNPPKNHPNPHQHRPKQNPTGGTPERGKPESMPEWSY